MTCCYFLSRDHWAHLSGLMKRGEANKARSQKRKSAATPPRLVRLLRAPLNIIERNNTTVMVTSSRTDS